MRCAELVRAWEREQGFEGFADGLPGTEGGRLRTNLRDQVRNALRAGHCTTNPSSWVFGHVARSLHPMRAGPGERLVLRSLITDGVHETRAELARQLARRDRCGPAELDDEAAVLAELRSGCSTELGAIVDAVVAYEDFAGLVDRAFRTLCAVSHTLGSQPLTPGTVADHDNIVRASSDLAGLFAVACDRMAAIGEEQGMEEQLGEFAIGRPPVELVELLFDHHERVQAGKPPGGKRSWFEPLRGGWVVRRALRDSGHARARAVVRPPDACEHVATLPPGHQLMSGGYASSITGRHPTVQAPRSPAWPPPSRSRPTSSPRTACRASSACRR